MWWLVLFRQLVVWIVLLDSVYAANIQKPKIDYGTNRIVPNRTVYSAITMSDGKSIAAYLHQRSEHGVHSNNRTQLEHDLSEIYKARANSREAIVQSMDFETFQWPMINTHACPHYPHSGHARTERGFGLSHLQIWLEFYFFDHDIIDAMHRKVPEYITSNSYSSVSGIFSSVQNGSIYKNGIPFLDDDITVIFEDTATWAPHSSASDSNSTTQSHNLAQLSAALRSMKTDILSLGTGKSPAPARTKHGRGLQDGSQPGQSDAPTAGTHNGPLFLTSNAYAITRQGARKLAACYDHCGAPLEEQVLHCAEAGLVTIAVHSPALFDTVVDPA
jgi:hypothetical protein